MKPKAKNRLTSANSHEISIFVRLTTKKTWTKEGRRRQSSESEISPSQLSSSSSISTQPTTTAGIMDVAQKKSVDEDSSSSTTSKSSEVNVFKFCCSASVVIHEKSFVLSLCSSSPTVCH